MNILRRLGEAQANLVNTRATIYVNQEQEKYLCGVVDTLNSLAQEEQRELAAAKKATEDAAKAEEGAECASPS